MKHFRVRYDQIDSYEVWIEVSDVSEDLKDVEALFIRNFEQYNDESECTDSDMIITSIREIDENGEDI